MTTPVTRRRLSRRQFSGILVGVAATTALSACGRRGSSSGRPTDTQTTVVTEGSAPRSTPSATSTPTRTGGVGRLVSPRSFTFDTWDTLRSGDASTLEVLGRTHSRLVQWADPLQAVIGPDLAARWEQPSPDTLVLRLDLRARWHDRPPLDGRAVTAEDVVDHLKRSLVIAKSGRQPAVQRAADYLSIRSVTSPAAGMVRIELARPDPFILYTLASRLALVQAPQAVAAFEGSWAMLDPAQVVGSGHWRFGGWDDERATFSEWPSGHGRPRLDSLEVTASANAIDLFVARRLDEVIARDRRETPAIRAATGDVPLRLPRLEESPVVSTFYVGAPPWNDPKLVRAISSALNRGVLAERLFGGRAVAWPGLPALALSGAFSGTDRELGALPGFRSPADDASEARALWGAAGGRALGAVTIDFPNIFDPLYSASSVVTGMLNEAIGTGQFRPAVETYTTIAKKAAEHRYGNGEAAFWFGWGPAVVEPEPSRWAIETFGSRSAGAATTGVHSAELDRLTAALASEPQAAERRKTLRELSLALVNGLDAAGYVGWLTQVHDHFRWPYLHSAAPTPWWDQHRDHEAFLDLGDASAKGRA